MRALLLEKQDNQTLARIQEISSERLPEGDVTVDINWSSLNYKDALAITGKGKIVRNFPMVPGIDFAGTVRHSQDDRFKEGQSVVLTGWGVGEHHWGGLAEQARVSSEWLVPLPNGLDERRAMIIGTAGFTAMLCVMALEEGGLHPDDGDILVTGASGGVGSTAIALLAALGYHVTAISGRDSNTDYLKALGAKEVLSRDDYFETPRPLEKPLWAGAVDTVGDKLLARVGADELQRHRRRLRAGRRLSAAHHRDAVYPAQCAPAGHRLGACAAVPPPLCLGTPVRHPAGQLLSAGHP